MNRHIVTRLMQLPLSVLGVTFVIFVLIRMSGDPVALYLPMQASPEARAALRQELGLDKPILIQYGEFVGNMLQGNFGQSLWYQKPAMDVVASYVLPTLELMVTAFVLAATLGILLGLFCAYARDSVFDHLCVTLAVLGQAMPSFWLGIMLILFFAVDLHWLPSSGQGGLANLVLPVITLIMYLLPSTLLLVRSTATELYTEEFLHVARAKGLSERAILWKHILKNALNPAVSSLGLQMGSLVGGAIVTETVFAWPGLGRLSVQSIMNRDMTVIQATVVVLAVWVILSNLIADIVNTSLDPRLRTE
ncbi:MAG: ABC transporter permease [Chloroflexi bacterium]|nr:ABC transporter permease [Chloroflexota bacterium]